MTNPRDTSCSGAALAEGDWAFLRALRELLVREPDVARIAALIEESEAGPRNGLVVDLALDAKGLCGLFRSPYTALSLRPDLADASPEALRARLVARIDAVQPGQFTLPAALYQCVVSAIDFGGRRIPVRPLASKPWDYTIFVGVEAPASYYVEVLSGGAAICATVKQLSDEDSVVVATLGPPELDRLVDRYR